MKLLPDIELRSGETLVSNAPEGVESVFLSQLWRSGGGDRRGPILHVARDDAQMARICELLSFLSPSCQVATLPAWDCLPYDRVGPHRDIVARRIDTLTRLSDGPSTDVVVTTVNAAVQRVPPRSAFAGRSLAGRIGAPLGQEELRIFCVGNGYQRVETVSEPGEFALRGGIVDVFPPGEPEPLRFDFFGDELESLRRFDSLSQRTIEPLDSFALKPVSEVILDEESITRFRTRYREVFGSVSSEDPLYEAISAGRPHPGMEHWLPLFYVGLETVFDYLPDATVTLDRQIEEARKARLENVLEFFDSRVSLQDAKDVGGWPYRPLPPEALYVDGQSWSACLADRRVAQFWPFAAPAENGAVLDAGGRAPLDFSEARTAADHDLFDDLRDCVESEAGQGRRVLLAGYSQGSLDRLTGLLKDHGLRQTRAITTLEELDRVEEDGLAVTVLGLERGFGAGALTVITEQDILGERLARPAAKRRRPENFLTEVTTLQEDDLVVHMDHGIGRYEGLQTLAVSGAPHDCLRLVYQGGDKLFVPVENIDVLSRFGSESAGVELDRLGQGQWQARKARVKARIKSIADELIKLAAARELKHSDPIAPEAGLYDEFCARFPFPETDDQLRAIEDTLDDLAAGRPMDRLVCGDVGFGKTEVALRAAFIAAMTGRQVAVVVPTTLLARQHYRTFRDRFQGLPVRIAQLSRLVAAKDAARIKDELQRGQIDIVIGTHMLLSQSIAFQDLALLIVDEEQHFGVKQKERLKRLREDVHVLTLTATPIPRTLQLALSGVREMSLIASPPVDRLAVRTFVLPYDPVIVREAILREHFRGGQVFYVCPRIEHLPDLQERLEKLVPEVKIASAHGRMAPGPLEAVMSAFVDRRFDLLLSTNIVESGLDIPNANTIVIHRADMFGLAQLYQLRGRIGRSKQRGYAYLTVPPGRLLTAAAERRLQVMQTLDTLGAGFTLASHDLDIRGAGNLLGEEQSGQIREVGIELYQQLLEEAVTAAREGGAKAAQVSAETWTPQISLGTSVLIPEDYVTDLNLRLGLYRRIALLVDRGEIDAFAAELIDRFGRLPDEVQNLLQTIAIKQLCREAGVEKIDAGPKGAVVVFRESAMENVEALLRFVQAESMTVRLKPDGKLVYQENWSDPARRVAGVQELLGELKALRA